LLDGVVNKDFFEGKKKLQKTEFVCWEKKNANR
jgi:hypothetical protein